MIAADNYRRGVILLFFILGFSLLISGCGGRPAKEEVISEGGTLTSTTTVVPQTFNPLLTYQTDSSSFSHYYLFEPLVIPDGETQQLKSCLATGWEAAEGGKVWTFTLREGVHWSDGAEFTAEDVIFTFKLIYDEQVMTNYRRNLLIAGEQIKVEALDKYTVQLTLPQPYAPLLRQLPVIVPKHKLIENWRQGNINQVWNVSTKPREIVGTGPFRLTDYRPGRQVVMEANPYYWQTDDEERQLPYIDHWVRKIVHSSEAKWEEFKQGNSDYVQVPTQNYDSLPLEPRGKDYRLVAAEPGLRTMFIVFNQNPGAASNKSEWKLKWFTNLHFRRAVAYAVDRSRISKQVFAGRAQPQWSPVSRENELFYNQEIKKYPYNLELARRELKQGGFTWNQAGRLVGPEGHPVKFELATNQNSSERQEILKIIAGSLEEVGMEIEFKLATFNHLIEQLINQYQYDGILIGFRNNSVEPHFRANIWQSSGKLHLWHPQQAEPATEWEAEIDRLFKQGAKTREQTVRREIYDQWQKIAAVQLPLIYIVNKQPVFAVRKRLQNTNITSYGQAVWGTPLWNAPRVYLRSKN